MANNETNNTVEYHQLTRYSKRKLVAMLKRLRHLIDTDVDKYIDYILSYDTNDTNKKPNVEILDNCAYMRDLVRYINQQLDCSSIHDSHQIYNDDIRVTPEQFKVLETVLRNSIDSNR